MSEPWGREWQKTPLSLPDHSHLPTLLLGDPKSEAGRAARTQINHLIACFLVTNPVSSASAAVACPVKQHESQGIPQQQSWLIKVRISTVGFLHLMAEHHHSYLPAVGMLLAVPLVPQIPGLCFTLPGHLTSCGHSQHHCLKPHVLCVLWLGNAALGAERGEGRRSLSTCGLGAMAAHGSFPVEPEPSALSLLPARSWPLESRV